MADDEMRLYLAGPHGGIDARAARNGLTFLLRWMRSLSDPEDRDKGAPWLLSRLSLGSVDCAISAPPDVEVRYKSVLRDAWSGVLSLVDSPGIPRGWNDTSVEMVVDLANLVKFQGVEKVELTRAERTVELDESFRVNASQSLSVERESLGSVRGNIVRYTDDGKKREIRIVETGSDREIKVEFGDNLERSILQALVAKNRVVAHGLLRRNSRGQKLSMSAESLRQLRSSRPPEQARAMGGALGPGWTGSLSSTEWVRSQRGEE